MTETGIPPATSAAGKSRTSRAGTDRTPNIILINCDDLGYGDLGCYGSELNTTPALDRLASQGMRFTDFYMASSVCSPSRGAMLTGCYPARIGFDSFDGPWVLFPGQGLGLNPSEITVAALLKRAGYATKLVGKWHCGDQPEFLPTRHGFDSYFGLPYSNDMGRQHKRDGTTSKYPPLPLLKDDTVVQEQPDQAGLTERYVGECLEFIRDHRSGPFFLYFAQIHVHLPIYTPERFLRESRNGRYGAGVAAADWAVGAILHELGVLGLEQDTLVIFTSDNGSRANDGGGSNAPLRGSKGSTWEGGLRVPCLMRWPGVVPAGRTCREVVTGMDFLPTLAALAGVEPPADRIIDGRSVLPLMRGEAGARSPHESFFYHHVSRLDGVRAGRWKLVVKRDAQGQPIIGEYALYDLEKDVGETLDLADRHPDVVSDLKARMQVCREDLGDKWTGTPPGAACRPLGRVTNPRPLTTYAPDAPYIMAEYDLEDCG